MFVYLWFMIMLHQAVVTNTNCTVSQCDLNFCDANNCSKCIDGYYLFNENCVQCFLLCRSCGGGCYMCAHRSCPTEMCVFQNCTLAGCSTQNNQYCTSCPDGYYVDEHNRCSQCSHRNCKCSTANNCTDCLPGKFDVKTFCENNCSISCKTCTKSEDCDECVSGKYGSFCQFDCVSQCRDGSCDKVTGNCPRECLTNQYTDTNNICKPCPDRCATCLDYNNCTSCNKTHYWGSACQRNCANCTGICSQDQGCLECHSKYFQVHDESLDGYTCSRCPDSCQKCNGSTNCFSCEDGYWGSYCQTDCVGCATKSCNKLTGSCNGDCVVGYFNSDNICKECMQNCELCNSDSICSKCKEGYFFQNNITCKECADTCKEKQCNDTNGVCLIGCVENLFGPYCNETCPSNCQKCEWNKTVLCVTCQKGFYGPDCKYSGSNDYNEKDGPQKKEPENQAGDEDSGIALTAGAGAGSAAVAIVVIVVVLIIVKRRRTSNQPDTAEDKHSFAPSKIVDMYSIITDGESTEPEAIKMEVKMNKVSKESPKQCQSDASVNYKNSKLNNQKEKVSNRIYQERFIDAQPGKEDELIKTKQTRTPAQFIIRQQQTSSVVKDSVCPVELSVAKSEMEVNADGIMKDVRSETIEVSDVDRNMSQDTIRKPVPVTDLTEYVNGKNFEEIQKEFQTLPSGLIKSYTVAKYRRNAAKNRYKDLYPYDDSRVIIKDGEDDYINASYIKGYNKPKEYIASAGPFKRKDDFETTADFWRMIWQDKCETVVMLTRCFEDMQHKCEQYWPDLGDQRTYGNLHVTCITEDQYSDFTIRSFVVNKDDNTLNVCHIQFTDWPDKGVPVDVTSMIEYRQRVRTIHKDKHCPLLVHCSAGIGRTGTFIALDMLIFMGETEGYVDIFGCVAVLRRQRVNLVQTSVQYVYLHRAILQALTFDCKSIPAENFITYYSQLIKKDGVSSQMETQFKLLRSKVNDLRAADKQVVSENKAFNDENGDGADISVDANRVRLFENKEERARDYINAIYINGFRTRNRFIAAQTPLPSTVVDFLTMIYQTNCSCVVMMEEPDLHDKTVGVYWPPDNHALKHGTFKVKCKESTTNGCYILKKLLLKHCTENRESEHYLNLFIFLQWPREDAVPSSYDSLLQMIKDVDKANHQGDNGDGPIIIHCMTGAERSCLYCAVSVLIEKTEIEHEVSVLNTLRQIKARRQSAIPTMEQYKFCHQAVISFIQTFDIYSNFELKSQTSSNNENDSVNFAEET